MIRTLLDNPEVGIIQLITAVAILIAEKVVWSKDRRASLGRGDQIARHPRGRRMPLQGPKCIVAMFAVFPRGIVTLQLLL